jgi:hypothetical protein
MKEAAFGENRECRLIFLFDSNEKPKARKFSEKSETNSHNGTRATSPGGAADNSPGRSPG